MMCEVKLLVPISLSVDYSIARAHVCVRAMSVVWTATVERNDLWPRYLASWFTLAFSGSS